MQLSEMDFEGTLKRIISADPPLGMQARLVCFCKSRLYQASCTRRRDAVRLAAVWSLTTVALGWAAFSAHQKHVRLRANLYGA